MFDVKVEKNLLTNIAYSEVGLEMHMDLQYYQSPPGLQMLHCYKYTGVEKMKKKEGRRVEINERDDEKQDRLENQKKEMRNSEDK